MEDASAKIDNVFDYSINVDHINSVFDIGIHVFYQHYIIISKIKTLVQRLFCKNNTFLIDTAMTR